MDRLEFEKRFITARRAAIEREFAHLNKNQREAVLTTKGPLLLLAGAGSGKTTVLMNRIANLLRYGCGSDSDYVPPDATEDDLTFLETYVNAGSDAESGTDKEFQIPNSEFRIQKLCAVDPVEQWRIIAITFTNKAAGEMKERLDRIIGPGAKHIWASTFHSACVRILRREIDRLGYDRSFAIYDTSDSASLIKRILKELDVEEKNFPHRTVLSYISRAKDTMTPAEDFLLSAEKTGDMRRKIIGRVFVEYEKRLRASNSLDFDDLILFTVRLFMGHPDVLEHYQKRFKYVHVDEYQDTNKLQYLFASALAGGHGNICVVGDDDQSIYKFRGATIENILSFEENFDNARMIRLEQNYRSTGLILNAANDLIKNNLGRKGKKLWTESGPGEKPELHIKSDERSEAQFVADKIVASVSDGRNWREHAVLYRMNAQSNQFETAFKRAGIPYQIFGGTGFYERAEIKDMLAYLCVIHNPDDDVRLLRIINDPPRGIGKTTVSRLTDLASEINKPVIEVIRESQNYDDLRSSAGRLHQFADLIGDLREMSETYGLDDLYDELLRRTGYIRILEEKRTDENLTRIENVRELKTNIIHFMNENGGSLFDFLNETALYTDLDREDKSLDQVVMMTMHSAKGLEFDTVFIVGADEGIFPSSRSIGEPDEIEEERRLCYVAMTRAMRMLYFTSAQQRMLFGKTSSALPSRFVHEINDGNIDKNLPEDRYAGQSFDFSGGFGRYSRQRQTSPSPLPTRPQPRSTQHSTLNTQHSTPDSQLSTLNSQFKKGVSVEHQAFGRGVITGVSPAGGDALLEISFEGAVVKRMLLKSAVRYMKII